MQYRNNFTIWYRNCSISEVDKNLKEQFMRNLLKLRFLWTFLTLFLVLSLIAGGCGKKEKKEEAKSATKQEVAQKASEEKVIKIGAILPLTGPLSFLGEPGKNAIELLKDKLTNENIQIILYDSKGDAKTGLTAFQKAYNVDKVKIVLTTLTNISLSIKPAAKENHVMQVIIAIYPNIASDYRLALQFCYNAVKETEVIKSYIEKKKPKKIFFFASRDGITNLQVKEYFIPWLKKRRIQAEVEWFDVGTKDFKTLVTKFGASAANLGILLGYGSDFQGILREIANYGLTEKVPLIGGIGYLELPQYVKYELVKNSVFIVPKFLVSKVGSQRYEEFRDNYKKHFGKEPTYDAAYTYDAVWTLLEAVKNIKSDDVEKIVQYILSNVLEGVTGPIEFEYDGTLKVDVILARFDEKMNIILAE